MDGILSSFITFFQWVFGGGSGEGAFTTGLATNLVTWIISTPLVMAVIAMFFAGFIVSIFFRIFHTA